jgi:hypothetical protein
MAPVGTEFFEAELEVSTVPVPDGPSAVCSSEVLMNCVAVTVKLELGGEEFAADDGFEGMAAETPLEELAGAEDGRLVVSPLGVVV